MGQAADSSFIDSIIHELRENVNRDKADVQRTVQRLFDLHITARPISSASNVAALQDHQDLTAHERHVANGRLTVNTDPTPATTDRMLTHSHRSTYLDKHNPSRRSVVVDMPAPKYGLPGIGEYEEKRKKVQQEWKEECQKQMTEFASQPKRRSKNTEVASVDYEEILARKRSEERKYRTQNSDPTYVTAPLRPFRSEGNLNTNRPTNGYGPENGVKFPNETRQPDSMRYSNQSESYDRFDGNVRDYTTNRVTSTRPHSYPTEYNSVLQSQPDVTLQNGLQQPYDDGFSPNNYRRQLDEQMRNIVERRQRELYEQDVENYYPNNIQQPLVDQNFESSRRHLGSNDGVFMTLDRTERAQMARKQMDQQQQIAMAAGYQADLALQMEETKQRKRDQKAEEMRYDMRIEEENKQYNPWGRGGAGAPVTDREGKAITVRGQLGNDRARKVSIVAPTVETNYLQRNLLDDIPAVDANVPVAPPSYASVQKSGPKPGRAQVAAATTLETYQEDLRRQIDDKRRRELEEKEKERLEEERLMRRVQEENEKMQLELEDERRKQKQKEEERIRRNEELLQRQQEQKKETERQKREEREKKRLEQWEEREKTQGRDFSPNGRSGGRLSPPVRGAKTNARKMSVAADNAKVLVANTGAQRPHQPLFPEEQQQNDAETVDGSREHVLSQLSAMRQQLEREQKMMQSQLKKEMVKMRDDDYVVMDKKPSAVPVASQNRAQPQRQERPPPINYRPITKSNTTNDASIAMERQPSVQKSTAESRTTLNMTTNKDRVHRVDPDRDDEVIEQFAPLPSHKSHVLWPNAALPRGAADHAQKTLKGDSFFLAGVESDDADDDGYGRWQDRRNSKAWSVDDDLQADSSKNRSLMKRNGSKQDDSSDDIQDDSFLDEFMGRNLHRR